MHLRNILSNYAENNINIEEITLCPLIYLTTDLHDTVILFFCSVISNFFWLYGTIITFIYNNNNNNNNNVRTNPNAIAAISKDKYSLKLLLQKTSRLACKEGQYRLTIQVYLLMPMERATLLNAKLTISHCQLSLITKQRASVDSKLLNRPKNVGYYHIFEW